MSVKGLGRPPRQVSVKGLGRPPMAASSRASDIFRSSSEPLHRETFQKYTHFLAFFVSFFTTKFTRCKSTKRTQRLKRCLGNKRQETLKMQNQKVNSSFRQSTEIKMAKLRPPTIFRITGRFAVLVRIWRWRPLSYYHQRKNTYRGS